MGVGCERGSGEWGVELLFGSWAREREREWGVELLFGSGARERERRWRTHGGLKAAYRFSHTEGFIGATGTKAPGVPHHAYVLQGSCIYFLVARAYKE